MPMQSALPESTSPAARDAARAPAAPLSGEDRARADLYALAARLLLAPPGAALLRQLGTADPVLAEGGDPVLEQAWKKLVQASATADPEAVRAEFDLLFLGKGRLALNPYGSLYLAGVMHGAPLAAVRRDLARHGIARLRGVDESEDHLGALCEAMRLLIAGGPGVRRQPHAEQQAFFEARIAPWYERCLEDIAHARGAHYYRLVAAFVGVMLEIEADAFVVEEGFDD